MFLSGTTFTNDYGMFVNLHKHVHEKKNFWAWTINLLFFMDFNTFYSFVIFHLTSYWITLDYFCRGCKLFSKARPPQGPLPLPFETLWRINVFMSYKCMQFFYSRCVWMQRRMYPPIPFQPPVDSVHSTTLETVVV